MYFPFIIILFCFVNSILYQFIFISYSISHFQFLDFILKFMIINSLFLMTIINCYFNITNIIAHGFFVSFLCHSIKLKNKKK